MKWLQGLLKSRQAQNMAYVASGRQETTQVVVCGACQASRIVLELLRQRKESAQARLSHSKVPGKVLLISPSVDMEAPSTGEFQKWLQKQSSRPFHAISLTNGMFLEAFYACPGRRCKMGLQRGDQVI